MALPRTAETSLQTLERLGAEASVKIDEAAEALLKILDDDVNLDDPSVVRNAEELALAVRTATPPAG